MTLEHALPPGLADPHASRGGVAAVAKAALVLQSFTALSPLLSVRGLAERTGIPRSTVHGLCVSLCDAGLLEEVRGRGYRLGPALVELGGQVIERTGLVDAAEGVLDRVLRREGTEAHLGQLVGGWVVYLDRASGVIRAPMNNRIGLRAPAHLTGCGKAALSLLPPPEALDRADRACRAERRPPPEPAALAAELAAIRRRGYAVSDTFQLGRLSVAAPIHDGAGQPLGGVSIAGPARIFSPPVVRATAQEIVAAAATISARLPVHGG